MYDVKNIWHVPLILEAQRAHETITSILRLGGAGDMSLQHWRSTLAERWDNLAATVRIAMVRALLKSCGFSTAR